MAGGGTAAAVPSERASRGLSSCTPQLSNRTVRAYVPHCDTRGKNHHRDSWAAIDRAVAHIISLSALGSATGTLRRRSILSASRGLRVGRTRSAFPRASRSHPADGRGPCRNGNTYDGNRGRRVGSVSTGLGAVSRLWDKEGGPCDYGRNGTRGAAHPLFFRLPRCTPALGAAGEQVPGFRQN